MPTITVKLDKKRAERLARWARVSKVTKSDIVRDMIDRGGPITTVDDLIAWGDAAAGKGLGLSQKRVLIRPVLLDSSVLIAYEREIARNKMGPARRFLSTLRGRPIVISIVSVEEMLEGNPDEEVILHWLGSFTIQGLHFAQARRCALLQRRSARRMGENDAWLVATAETLGADVVGADRAAFERLGSRYLRFQ